RRDVDLDHRRMDRIRIGPVPWSIEAVFRLKARDHAFGEVFDIAQRLPGKCPDRDVSGRIVRDVSLPAAETYLLLVRLQLVGRNGLQLVCDLERCEVDGTAAKRTAAAAPGTDRIGRCQRVTVTN